MPNHSPVITHPSSLGENWRRIEYLEGDGPRLLAGNLALAEAVGRGEAPPTLRWYRYRRPCLVLGYGQKLSVVDGEACSARGIPVLRRPAGGSAVLADDGLLGMAAILRLSHPLAVSDLTLSYRWLGETWVAALGALGIDARLVDVAEARADSRAIRIASLDGERTRGLACFGTFSPYEVAVGRRKIVGLAQMRRRGAVLFQVGVPLRSAPRELASLLTCPPEHRDSLAEELAARATDLATELGHPAEPHDAIGAFERELQIRWGIRLTSAPLSEVELSSAEELLPRVVLQSAPGALLPA